MLYVRHGSRVLSLTLPYRGDDDYFTSTLDDATVKRVWGRFKKPVLVLHSEKDEFVPARVDPAALNKRYQDANPVVSKLSGLVPGAGHTILNDEGRQWTVQRVQAFLEEIAA
jgi:pimeloyl-ACP methyl ester carboxylesterase